MPELPEVETIVRDLKKSFIGQEFVTIESEVPKNIFPDLQSFSNLKGKLIKDAFRKGKFICLLFENEMILTVHLRMSGRLIIKKKSAKKEKHDRTRFEFSDYSLIFQDIRKFGRVWLTTTENHEKDTGIKNLGVEPLSPFFTQEKLAEILKRKKGSLKKNLLDQSLIAGIGNIYADEACFLASILPEKDITLLKKSEIFRLYKAIIQSLENGIKNKGTSISDYTDAFGNAGTNQHALLVYGRKGQPCKKCNETLSGKKVAGRSTVFCKYCQK